LPLAGTIDLGRDADNVRIDPKSGNILVGYGSGAIATIDAATGTKTGAVNLPVHPEGFQIDPSGTRIYVNLPTAHRIAVIDRATGSIVSNWSTGTLTGNFPMAIDDKRSLVAVVFRFPSTLVIYDAANGSVKSQLPTCGDADDVFVDPKRSRIYVSCGSGAVDVFEAGAREYKHIARIATASGARTSLFVPELDRLFVAARATSGTPAAIRIFRPER
jgi:DNA-binding beta-propeller fold protein YncE